MPTITELSRRNFSLITLAAVAALATGCGASEQPPPFKLPPPTLTLRPSEGSYNAYLDSTNGLMIKLPTGESIPYDTVLYEEFAALVPALSGSRLTAIDTIPPTDTLPDEFAPIPETKQGAIDRFNALLEYLRPYDTAEAITGGNHTVTLYKPQDLALAVSPGSIQAYLDWAANTILMKGNRASGPTVQHLVVTNFALNPLIPKYPNSVTVQFEARETGLVTAVSCVNMQGSIERRYGPDFGLAVELGQAMFALDLPHQDKERVAGSLAWAYKNAWEAWLKL